MRGYVLGPLALNVLTLIWGTTFGVVKGAVEGMALLLPPSPEDQAEGHLS